MRGALYSSRAWAFRVGLVFLTLAIWEPESAVAGGKSAESASGAVVARGVEPPEPTVTPTLTATPQPRADFIIVVGTNQFACAQDAITELGFSSAGFQFADLANNQDPEQRQRQFRTLYVAPGLSAGEYEQLREMSAPGGFIEQFVSLGGLAVLNLAGDVVDGRDLAPRGVGYSRTALHNQQEVLTPAHPYLSGDGYGGEPLGASDFSAWGPTDQGVITSVPEDATVVLGNIDGPSWVEYTHGSGRAIVTSLSYCTDGLPPTMGAALRNLLKYSRFFEGGALTPAPTVTPTLSPTPTIPGQPTSTVTNTRPPTSTRTPTHTGTPTSTRTASRTRTPTSTRFPTRTPTDTRSPTVTRTATRTRTGTRTLSPTSTPTDVESRTPTPLHTASATASPTAAGTATRLASPTPSPTPRDGEPAFISVDLFADRRGDNNDGSFTTIVSAIVSDSMGNPVRDRVPVDFSLVPAAPGLLVTARGVTNSLPDCDISSYVADTGRPVVPERGTALACLRYVQSRQGEAVTVAGEVRSGERSLRAERTVILPSDRATPTTPSTPIATTIPTETVPSASPTRTQSGQAPCPGDCNLDRVVTVDELVSGVSIALGSASVDECPSLDSNLDGSVTVDELMGAIQAALNGCPRLTAAAQHVRGRLMRIALRTADARPDCTACYGREWRREQRPLR